MVFFFKVKMILGSQEDENKPTHHVMGGCTCIISLTELRVAEGEKKTLIVGFDTNLNCYYVEGIRRRIF